jgi:transcriptional antiterminator RfaH
MYGPATSTTTKYTPVLRDPLGEISWYCLRTAPKHEHLAAKNLQSMLQVETFAPRLRFKKATRRGPVWFVEAMFPSYIFARFPYRDLHRQVHYAPGVSSIVRFGDQVIPLPDETVDGLREVLGGDSVLVFDPSLNVGDSIHIAEGAFQGLEAVVTQLLPAIERLRVLVDFLGRQIEAEVDAQKVLPTGSPRRQKLPARA